MKMVTFKKYTLFMLKTQYYKNTLMGWASLQ